MYDRYNLCYLIKNNNQMGKFLFHRFHVVAGKVQKFWSGIKAEKIDTIEVISTREGKRWLQKLMECGRRPNAKMQTHHRTPVTAFQG